MLIYFLKNISYGKTMNILYKIGYNTILNQISKKGGRKCGKNIENYNIYSIIFK